MNAMPPSRERYAPTVSALMPGSMGEDLEIRCSLLLTRDCAMSAKLDCGEEAFPVMEQIERIASRYAFQPMPLDDLRGLRDALRKLVAAAATIEDWAKPAAGKVTNARG
jgi:hypothetical protein